jgi:uncharacterized membrane protein required for colicin V production
MTIGLVIDIVLSLICLIIIIKHAANGFIRSFMGFARAVLAIFISYLFYVPFAKLLGNLFFTRISEKWVSDAFSSTYNAETGLYDLYKVFDGIPNWFVKVLTKSGVDDATIQTYLVEQNGASPELADTLVRGIGGQLSMLLSTILAIIILFIVVQIALVFVGKLLENISKLPVFRVLNIILGALIGAVISAVLVWLVSEGLIWIINFIARYNESLFAPIPSQSVFLEYFKDRNIWELARARFGY